jgi:hypothetical protein
MTAALETAVCQRLDRWLSAYVDGELDAVHCLDVEDHIENCEVCCERIAMLHAAKVSVHEVLSEQAPQALRERVCRTLLDERLLEDKSNATDGLVDGASRIASLTDSGAPRPATHANKLRFIVPLAAAATVALMIGAMSLSGVQVPGLSGGEVAVNTEPAPETSNAATQSLGSIDSLVEDLVSQHAFPPKLDVTDPATSVQFGPILDAPVNGAAYEEDFGARYVGARRNPRAGMLQYVKRNQNRVTMYVFNTRRVDVNSQKLATRRIGARKVYVGKVRGYPVAASERNGVGYALTADDLSAEEATDLVLAASR